MVVATSFNVTSIHASNESIASIPTYTSSKAKTSEIWFIRHCDKPQDDDNSPCCSSTGYDRAKGWPNYFKGKLGSNSIVLTSNFKESDDYGDCKKGVEPSSTDGSCQHSQRMYITAYDIAEGLGFSTENMVTDYCSGSKSAPDDVASYLQKALSRSQLVVWEHKQIPDIITGLGIKLDAWPSELSDVYNIVFRIQDVGGDAVMQYTCYNYEDGSEKCSKDTENWLASFDQI